MRRLGFRKSNRCVLTPKMTECLNNDCLRPPGFVTVSSLKLLSSQDQDVTSQKPILVPYGTKIGGVCPMNRPQRRLFCAKKQKGSRPCIFLPRACSEGVSAPARRRGSRHRSLTFCALKHLFECWAKGRRESGAATFSPASTTVLTRESARCNKA